MIGEIGVFSLILALLFALLLTFVPSLLLWRGRKGAFSAVNVYVFGQFLFVVLSYLCLTVAFLLDDFTLSYVEMNSSLYLPWFYKLCAVWGGHEGSMLLWVLILSGWMLALRLFSASIDKLFRLRLFAILGCLSVGFLLFLLLTSNPFARLFQTVASVGRDLNPLLQDPGFLLHPPMLYMGYVGFSVAFAFAIAALWMGKLESNWTKWVRPWTLAAWCSLTIGITLGSWWAYRELGWGGFWFWDPVENASFMPWLTGTALLHSLLVTERRQQFLAWTLLLSITAFSLSLVGTFLVRSGVLTSVHAFAVDPLRGIYILGFLLFVIGGALLLFALRAQTVAKHSSPALVSKETALLLNNVFLIVMMLTVLMGTVYPLLIDGLNLGKLSVGAAYFNTVFIPLMIPFLLLMGLGIHLSWQGNSLKTILAKLSRIFILSMLLPFILLRCYSKDIHFYTLLGLMLASWVILSCIKLAGSRIKQRGASALSRSFYGMLVAHTGVAISLIGIAMSSGYGLEDDVKISIGQSITFADYHVTFQSQSPLKGPNYQGIKASFEIRKGDYRTVIYPEKRIYTVGGAAMSDAAIDRTLWRDLYLALGEMLDDSSWTLRLYFKPLVRFIWGGGFMMLLGGLLALSDKRYFNKYSSKKSTTMEVNPA